MRKDPSGTTFLYTLTLPLLHAGGDTSRLQKSVSYVLTMRTGHCGEGYNFKYKGGKGRTLVIFSLPAIRNAPAVRRRILGLGLTDLGLIGLSISSWQSYVALPIHGSPTLQKRDNSRLPRDSAVTLAGSLCMQRQVCSLITSKSATKSKSETSVDACVSHAVDFPIRCIVHAPV